MDLKRNLISVPWNDRLYLKLKKGEKVTFLHWNGGFVKGSVVSGGSSFCEWEYYEIKYNETIYGIRCNLNSKLTGIKLKDGSIYLSTKY